MTLKRYWRRLKSERGSVGVVVAIFIFFALGMLTMIWNTTQLSKEKMRLQNAADAAALAHAVWQARGMNAVQNINDEMYESLNIACKLRTVAQVSEAAAQILDIAAAIPVVGMIAKGLAYAAHFIGVTTGGIGGWLANRICKYFLNTLALLYANLSTIMGYWNAEQVAAHNGADPLAKWGGMEKWGYSFGAYALGISWPILPDSLRLPLWQSSSSEIGKKPWKVDKIGYPFDTASGLWKGIYKACGTADGWEIKPYVSKRGSQEGLKTKKQKNKTTGKEETVVEDDSVLPGPTLWVAFKLGKHIHTTPIDDFFNKDDKDSWTHGSVMIALSAAQCITGDVIPHSNKTEKNVTNLRPAGFGVGATAKLVPVTEVAYKIAKPLGVILDAAIYH